ncbi:hypothetical protein E5288_WYG014181 [Bos mutus]|uniref:Uncharacterized protein n=1 Tax=Bos mutus TaxID=72004 RepID=A0A6B0R4R3_9CETA|nr:hypothetical protein [Bos mutus]
MEDGPRDPKEEAASYQFFAHTDFLVVFLNVESTSSSDFGPVHVDCGPGRGLDAAGHLSEALCWRAEALWTFRLTARTDQERNEASRQEIEKQGL